MLSSQKCFIAYGIYAKAIFFLIQVVKCDLKLYNIEIKTNILKHQTFFTLMLSTINESFKNSTENPTENPLENPLENTTKNPTENPLKNPLKNPQENPQENPPENAPENAHNLFSNNSDVIIRKGSINIDPTRKIYGINIIYVGTFILFAITFLIDCLLAIICNVIIEWEVSRILHDVEHQNNEEPDLIQCYWICIFLFLRSVNIGFIFPLVLIKFVYENEYNNY